MTEPVRQIKHLVKVNPGQRDLFRNNAVANMALTNIYFLKVMFVKNVPYLAHMEHIISKHIAIIIIFHTINRIKSYKNYLLVKYC